MGDALYDALLAERSIPCRVYAPVGGFTELLPYLVRRLLENGANTSFVHQIADPDVPVEALVADPLASLPVPYAPDPRIPLPRDLYPDRQNSRGLDLNDQQNLRELATRTSADREAEPMPPVEDTSPQELEFTCARRGTRLRIMVARPCRRTRGAVGKGRRPARGADDRARFAHRARRRPHL